MDLRDLTLDYRQNADYLLTCANKFTAELALVLKASKRKYPNMKERALEILTFAKDLYEYPEYTYGAPVPILIPTELKVDELHHNHDLYEIDFNLYNIYDDCDLVLWSSDKCIFLKDEQSKRPTHIPLAVYKSLREIYENEQVYLAEKKSLERIAKAQEIRYKTLILDKETGGFKEPHKTEYKHINKNILASSDLLDNLLLLYMIKRAQRGDQCAVNILSELVDGELCNSISAFCSIMRGKIEKQAINEKDVLSLARLIARLFISGDNPHELKRLLCDKKSIDAFGTILNRKVAHTIVEVAKVVPGQIKDWFYLLGEKLKLLDNVHNIQLINEIDIIIWQIQLLLSPITWITADLSQPKLTFNRQCYDASYGVPFTTYLKRQLWFFLKDWLKRIATPMEHDSYDDDKDYHREQPVPLVNDELAEYVSDWIYIVRPSPRYLEVIQMTIGGYTRKETARKVGYSKRTVQRIVKNFIEWVEDNL